MNAMDYKRRAERRRTLYVISTATMLGATVGLGLIGGAILGDFPGSWAVVLAGSAVSAVWISRLLLCTLVWVDTGVWGWRQTGVLRSIRAGRDGTR